MKKQKLRRATVFITGLMLTVSSHVFRCDGQDCKEPQTINNICCLTGLGLMTISPHLFKENEK